MGHTAIYTMEAAIDGPLGSGGQKGPLPLSNGGLGGLMGCFAYGLADKGEKSIFVMPHYVHGFGDQQVKLAPQGNPFLKSAQQLLNPVMWSPRDYGLEQPDISAKVSLYDQEVTVKPWVGKIKGIKGKTDIVLLDVNTPENSPWVRGINDRLYTSDEKYRLAQSVILGFAGPEILKKLGYDVDVHAMQEGATAFVAVKLLQDLKSMEAVRQRTAFTNHTVVPAGMHTYDYGELKWALHEIFGDYSSDRSLANIIEDLSVDGGSVNMNKLGARLSGNVNGVSQEHADVMSRMNEFAGLRVDGITNAVHTRFISERMKKLFDESFGERWRLDHTLMKAERLDAGMIEYVHGADKADLVKRINKHGILNGNFAPDVHTVAVVRRMATYKRNALLLTSLMEHNSGWPVQVVYAGKAHPNDFAGQQMLDQIIEKAFNLPSNISFAFLPNYDTDMSKLIVAGADLLAITALPEQEASGTSGMKFGLNGNPSLSSVSGFISEVDPKFWYKFEGQSDEELHLSLAEKFWQAHHDDATGRLKMMRSGIIEEFSQFHMARMVDDYLEAFKQVKKEEILV